MNEREQILCAAIDGERVRILAAERQIWTHPESGYREWNTHRFMKAQFEELGYTVTEAGNIPGFYTDIDTGKPGPTVGVFAEMDSLIVPTHPEADKVTGAVHACGHNAQCAAMLGVAAALKAPNALAGLSGRIRLLLVPAEELIELEYRSSLRAEGKIHYFGGKQEFLYRGYLDGVDLSFMIHTGGGKRLGCDRGSNGCIIKVAEFQGRATHASAPQSGVNALYAANTALTAANALRETFSDSDFIRFHPIVTAGGSAVNSIPDRVTVESYIRGATMDAIYAVNRKINRAFAGSAAAIGCGLRLEDHHGYAPRLNDATLAKVFRAAGENFFAPENLGFGDGWGMGCSDMGDISCVMPASHPHIGGAAGAGHGADYRIVDPEIACVTSAKTQSVSLALLLENGGALAKEVIANAKVPYKSKEEYFAAVDSVERNAPAVTFVDSGSIMLNF